MLVLTRKLHEEIRIGADITVSVVEISGNRIRLGITAPADVVVLRGELLAEAEVNRSPAPEKALPRLCP